MRGAPSPLALEKYTRRPFMAPLPRSAQVAGGVEPNSLVLYWMTACVSRSVIQVASGSRRSLATASMAADLNGFSRPALLHQQQSGEIGGVDHVDLRPAGVGLGQYLGGDIARAAAKILHLDAVLCLEGGDDGVDDLGIEAGVEQDACPPPSPWRYRSGRLLRGRWSAPRPRGRSASACCQPQGP